MDSNYIRMDILAVLVSALTSWIAQVGLRSENLMGPAESWAEHLALPASLGKELSTYTVSKGDDGRDERQPLRHPPEFHIPLHRRTR